MVKCKFYNLFYIFLIQLPNCVPQKTNNLGNDDSTEYFHILELFDAYNMEELSHKMTGFFKSLQFLGDHCDKGKDDYVIIGLGSLARQKLTTQLIQDSELSKDFVDILKNPEVYLTENKCNISIIPEHLVSFKSVVSTKVCVVLLNQTARLITTARNDIYDGVRIAYKNSRKTKENQKSDLNQVRFSMNGFLTRTESSWNEVSDKNRIRVDLVRKAVDIISKFRPLGEKLENDLENLDVSISDVTIWQLIDLITPALEFYTISNFLFVLLTIFGTIYIFLYPKKFLMGLIVGVMSTLVVVLILSKLKNFVQTQEKLVDEILESLTNSRKDLGHVQRALLAGCTDI